jgi:predicted nucleotidyltransferase
VKGLVHPPDRIIAYLRYVPDTECNETGYRKVYNLGEREEYLALGFPEYLWYSDVYGRVVQSVPVSRIDSVLKPVEYLNYMKNHYEDLNKIQKSSLHLASEIVHSTQITWSDIGITGSQLLGIARDESDIDLVVFGEAACHDFYSNMCKKYYEIPGIVPYAGDTLQAHLRFRWESIPQYHSILGDIESKKILQGFFYGYEFFIRLVKLPHEVNEPYGKVRYEMMGFCKSRFRVSDDTDSIFTPCIYEVESQDHPKLRRVVSYRGRFTEQVEKGAFVEAKGRLENVTNIKTGERFQQLVLGEDPTDYLIPI